MFITLEGIEGSGKTTQIKPLVDCLGQNGYEAVVTREPGATVIGKKIRAILLDPGNSGMSDLCELFLYGADRAQHLSEVIIPALGAGKTVVCDRFTDATTVYQGAARGISKELIDIIHSVVVKDLCPDLTILFDLDPETGLARTVKALTDGERTLDESRFERETLEFHERVRQGYLALAAAEQDRFLVVDARGTQEQVFTEIVSGINRRLGIDLVGIDSAMIDPRVKG
ncbi:Tmk [Desulforapulum autotrophicum HRM2]|uniref:Thymidylate kinase n=1 Tax=Desulforapulum autotrophicum (strain ATCC 43914 / DSM 3382 / VKM B-1955 / HRM2) TaxID=177437 RepID=KTHY_DESAH|nr:dTMP kinase [Desulforapulum autotrophicum]C0QI33.1 RecName: Full=Thymidylate kinase; AltName: Full=dTMP kinase [Desulforapulum autotrophicum HRM2]ACN15769.1 Tmk [Desulforapulum autotrophicum HRM2]